ncbi:Putative teichuronic acid biosynthesis glycosyltransferase TuaG [Polaribacter huanghezhanensis]|nr:Putative teichuronic acid biosynthesis glycosyltransferase TuaG [Polaribacter huanghezhanensis]
MFITETITSIQKQTYENWELLITDDGSTDNSIKIIKEFLLKDSRIKLFSIKNSGAAVARNNSIKKSKGSYIAFLDSDDLWFPNKLELQIKFMETHNYNFTHTSYKKISDEGEDLNLTVTCNDVLTYDQMLSSNKIGCLTVMYNVDCIGKIYMPIIRKRQDYALWLKILKINEVAYGLNVVLSKYRLRSNSISNNKFEMLKWNWLLFRKIEKLSFFKSLYLVTSNILIKIFK